MKILDGEVLPGDTVIVGADPRLAHMTFAHTTAKPHRRIADAEK